jgi:transposase InsO family protein
MKTLKYEEVYRQEYRGMAEALASIGEFIDRTYNQKRLHSALGYRPPEEFERISIQCCVKRDGALGCVF